MASITTPVQKVSQRFENAVVGILQKFGFASAGAQMGRTYREPEPPYERRVPPRWIYQMRRKQTLINNSIEEKVNQTFRRGFAEWEQEYVAKCLECGEEFETYEPFRNQLGDAGQELTEDDFEFDTPRICPECEELAEMKTPDDVEKERGQRFLDQVNERGRQDQFLEGPQQNSVGQTFIEVCKEVAWDIEAFDDGWMIFKRDYSLNHNGEIIDWDLREVHRAPPELMRYSVDDDNEKGGKYWICPKCRATDDHYQPQEHGTDCETCDGKTYRVYAELMKEPGGETVEYFIRGEFAHGSEYEPGKFYGFSPIITLWEEARTLEQMDSWYKEAYEERRAPRGAMVVRSSNAESVRSWNQQQMEALRDDPQHIPTFIDDTEGKAKPLTWEPLLEEPAQMQHMQMREWFLDRISAKFGVTAIFQKAAPENSGLSQSMEIVVSNRSAMRLKQVYDDIFIPAFLSQLQIDGWELEVAEPEEEDEVAEAERLGKELQNVAAAQQAGLEVEWTPQDRADVKPGMAEPPEQEGGLGGMMGGGEGGPDAGGGGGQSSSAAGPFDSLGPTGPSGGRPTEANETGGEPRSPSEPTQDNPIQAQDDAVTTGDSGYSNATYGGRRGGVINIFDHIRSQMDETSDANLHKRLRGQAKKAFDVNYAALGIDADTIEAYATDADKTFAGLCEHEYGRWQKTPDGREAARELFQLLGGRKE